jgi:serine/threonine protein kinase
VMSGWSVVVPEGYVVSRWRVGAPIATGSWGSVYEARLAAGPEPSPGPASSPRPEPSLPPGPELAAEPGSGRAYEPEPDPVAVKFLPTGTITQRQLAHLADMARREREAYRQLRHPRLARLVDAVVIDDRDHPELDGAIALVTERAEASLADVVTRAAGRPVAGALRILTEICEGLAHMHAVGWVHGDLKPSNILVMPDGSVRLADFGLSAELDGTHGYLPPVGTSDYLPPERWSEQLTERGVAVRESADIWAFGVIACLLLTGHLPFPGHTARARVAAAAAYAASGVPGPLVGGLPPQWQQMIMDCLAPDHSRRRHWTAARLLERLRNLEAVPAPAERRWHRRYLSALAAAVITVAGGAATAAAVWMTSGPAADYSHYFRPGSGIPARYEAVIVKAGTMCQAPGVSPALVAAILKAESGFKPDMSNPATKSYGIAGWTPAVMWHYMDPPVERLSPRYAMTPAIAIPALGRYLCQFAPTLMSVPGDHAVNLAAAYQTADYVVRRDHGVPPEIRAYAAAVRRYLHQYLPAGG